MSEPSRFDDTIVALSSGALPAGIAVLRASGRAASALLASLAGVVPPPRQAVLRTIRDAAGEALDRGLVLFFPGPHSVTGEDVAEFHLHGGRAVVSAFLAAAVRCPGVRLAQPGEFTRRAFVNGRMDLTEAEGLADLLAAETQSQRRQARLQAEGAHRKLYQEWAGRLLHARALLEADFDFPDEDDIGDSVAEEAFREAESLRDEIAAHLEAASRGEIRRDGFRVALAGSPNAGKSSLLNALARRDAAIVSPVAGTTRDLVEVSLDLGGIPVRLVDTAGLREATDAIESIGIERAIEAIEAAHLVILLVPPEESETAALTHVKQLDGDRLLVLDSKSDVRPSSRGISALTGTGLDGLERELSARAARAAGDLATLVPTRERHRIILRSVLDSLSERPVVQLPPEMAAETLRNAAGRLAELTGKTGVEDILDVVFSQFCLGK